MQSGLRDGPGLITRLWDRQAALVVHTLDSAGLGEMADDLFGRSALEPGRGAPDAKPLRGSAQDLLTAIPRELCSRMRFRRGWLWLTRDGEPALACTWPRHGRVGSPSVSDRRALEGRAALAPGACPKSLSVPIRSHTGDVCGVVHLAQPTTDHPLCEKCLALAERYGEVASAAFHKIQLARMLEETQRLLDSKSVALRESHHRIKNNLQALAGLLAATGVQAHSRRVREALGESVTRLKAIASIHDMLTAHEAETIELGALVENLLNRAFPTLFEQDAPIRICTQIQGCRRPTAQATPLALVINELLTNCIRHAFIGGRGEITLALRDGAECVLTVADDGGTLPPGPLDQSRFGLGLHIVRSIVCRDLGGTFQIVGGARTVATARLPQSRHVGTG